MSESAKPKSIPLPYKLSKDFLSTYADGTWVSGPVGGKNNKYTIMFYNEAVTVTEQLLDLTEDGAAYRVNNEAVSFLNFREHTARISMDEATLISLRNAIDDHLKKNGIDLTNQEPLEDQ